MKLSAIMDEDIRVGYFQFFEVNVMDTDLRSVVVFCCEVWEGDEGVV